jgi:hypothetical protein
VCKADCLLFSNTSSLDLDALAHALPPARMPCLAGLHFFSPAHVMKLVEVIATQGSRYYLYVYIHIYIHIYVYRLCSLSSVFFQ